MPPAATTAKPPPAPPEVIETLKCIAAHLGISDQTVNTHIKNMYRKLQVRTRAQAVSLASQWGLLS